MKKPAIIIENNEMKTDLSLCEKFTDSTMVETYNNMQALIDLVCQEKEVDAETE